MRQTSIRSWAAAVVLVTAAWASADTYSDGTLTIDWTFTGAAGVGKFNLGGKDYPATATKTDNAVAGTFKAGSREYKFDGTLAGDTLTLTTGGKTYTLKNTTPATDNPLGAEAAPPSAPAAIATPANSNTSPVAAGPAPAGYTVVTHTDVGQSLSADKPDAATVHDAIFLTTNDIAKLFDARPAIAGAYEDAKDHKSGGATFTATMAGKPMRGIISAKLVGHGAQVAVVYGRTDATVDQWNQITAAPPPVVDPAVAAVKLNPYTFPDGTGTIGLADGWTTEAKSDLDRIFIQGPAGQHLVIGGGFLAYAPDAPVVVQAKQMEARSRRMGMKSMPAPFFVAPFSEPAEGLKVLVPQISERMIANGNGSMRLDQIVSSKPIPSMAPNGRAAIVEYLITRVQNGQPVQTHNIARIEDTSMQGGAWNMYMIEMTSPVDTYAKDKPTMVAMMLSQRENVPVCQQIMAQRQQQANEQLHQQGVDFQKQQAAQQARNDQAHRDQMAGYDAHNKQWAQDENTKARSADNFVEMIRGYRTVVDTRTGETASVDLNEVHGVVEGLNQNDAGHYAEVPYRDEKDPTIGR